MRSYAILPLLLVAVVARAEPVRLVDTTSPGRLFRVTTDSTIAGELTPPAEKNKSTDPIKVTGSSRIDYVERILSVASKDADHKTLRIYERVDFKKTTADRSDESTLRPSVRRLVVMKKGHHKVPFSPDGPLLWSEIDLVRTDLVSPALGGLLAAKPVEPGDTWNAAASAVIELTDFENIDKGELVCKFERIETNGPRSVAHVSFAGDLQGINEDGPTRQKLKGRLIVDLKAECITFLQLDGEHFLLDAGGKEAGKIIGTFSLTRMPLTTHKDLSDAAIKDISLEPSDENTRLLFDSEELGVRFMYQRNWRFVRSTGRQLTLDDSHGSGLLITLDNPGTTPPTDKYLRDSIKDLADRGAKVLKKNGPEKVADGIDRFTLDVQLDKETVAMDYFVIRQDKGGATLASRLPSAHREARMKELERLSRSFTITRRLDGK
jgi:hypothetical protein